MKTLTKRLLLLGAGIAASLMIVAAVLWLAGIRNFYLHHVIATFEIQGVKTAEDVQEMEWRFQAFPDVRQIALTRSSWQNDLWIARIQFRAADPAAGRRQIRDWLQSIPSSQELRLVKATFYDVRIHRPAHGDIVFGKTISLEKPL